MTRDDEIALRLGRSLLNLIREAVHHESKNVATERQEPAVQGRGMPLAPKVLYSRKEAAAALSISQRSLDHLIAYGQIKAIRKGSRILVHRSVIESWARRDDPRPIRELRKSLPLHGGNE